MIAVTPLICNFFIIILKIKFHNLLFPLQKQFKNCLQQIINKLLKVQNYSIKLMRNLV